MFKSSIGRIYKVCLLESVHNLQYVAWYSMLSLPVELNCQRGSMSSHHSTTNNPQHRLRLPASCPPSVFCFCAQMISQFLNLVMSSLMAVYKTQAISLEIGILKCLPNLLWVCLDDPSCCLRSRL